MFMGEYTHSIDSKGRMIIPAKFREGLGENFVLTRGLDHCLFVYPQEEWSELEKKLRRLPLTKSEARTFMRFFFSGAAECELDKQGRVLVPNVLRQYAELGKEVVVLGVSSRVEVWSKEKWEAYSTEASMDYEAIAEKLVDLDIEI